MNEFNPFDDLGITFGENENLKETRRDRNYMDLNKYNPFDMNENIKIDTNPEPEYQPDFTNNLVKIDNPKDLQITKELGIDLPEVMGDDEKQAYVDGLSKEDWKTWNNLKQEGYSFEWRKALLDNREDLYDITESGNKKYRSWNKSSLMQYLLNQQHDIIDLQEDVIHPWSESIQDWLNVYSSDLMNYSYDEIHNEQYNKVVDENDNNLVRLLKRWATVPDSLVKRWAAVAGWILLDLAWKAVNLIDALWSISSQAEWVLLNNIADERKGYDLVTNDPSKQSNIYWDYVQAVSDVMGTAFTMTYPMATWIISVLGTESDFASELMDAANNWIKGVFNRIDKKTGLDEFNKKYLTPEEQEIFRDNEAMATWVLFSSTAEQWLKWLSKTEVYKRFQQSLKYAKKTSKVWLKEWLRDLEETKNTLEQQPVWTEVSTPKGTKIWEITPEWLQTTPYWSLKILKNLAGSQLNWWIRWFKWAWESMKNKDKIVTRDPKAPVWELPVVKTPDVTDTKVTETPGENIKIENEIKETPKEEIKTPKKEVKVNNQVPTGKKVDTNENQIILEYIKKISNDLTGKKGWMNSDLYDKFTSSKDLQTEYVNTIDPYIRANGAENPAWVIDNQLTDFVDTVKNQLQDRINKNIDFRKWQIKYKVQIPESDKIQWEKDNTEIKDLIKILSKGPKESEKYLNYLLNLPKQKIQSFDKLIPDFSKNLGLIKDTLDITKAITSRDLLWKFLQFKSTRGSRNKNFIRKYLYKKLNEAYRKAWIQYNMKQIENILNQMSEEELVQLENEFKNGEVRPFESDAEVADLEEKWYMPNTWIKANQNINEIMDSIRPWTNKTTREYLKEKGVQLSLTDERWLRKIGWDIQAAYSARLDRILMKSEDNPYKGIIYHEFGHRVLDQLGTTQIMDIITHIAERDWITQGAAFERRAEYFRNYLEYNNIDGKKYLVKNLGKDIVSKINATMEKTKEEIWDLFDLNEWDKNINQILSEVKHDTPAWQDITSRRPEPLIKDMVGDAKPVRSEYLRTIDPNIEGVEIYPYFDKPIIIRFKDGSSKKWTDYRKTLTKEQLNEIDTYETGFIQEYVDEILGRDKWFKGEGKFDYDTLKNEKDLTDILTEESIKNVNSIMKSFDLDKLEAVNYMKSLRNIDPDIIWLVEKDGKICVKILLESFWERWEMSDRPGMQEIKTIPIEDFFVSPEEIKQLPEDLQKTIEKQKALSNLKENAN